jgi:AbrB family looped-hinge helix DNA binding protein
LSVEVGKYGRIILPQKIRKKYGVHEGFRLIVTESMGRICLVPVKSYSKPTDALYGSIKVDKPIEEPKTFAREFVRKKLLEDML